MRREADILVVTSRVQAEEFEQRAHAFMQATVPRYRADRWAVVQKHPTENQHAVYIDERVRGAFSPAELALLRKRSDDWKDPAIGPRPV